MSFYNPNIPQSTDFLSDSQQDIQSNFQQLDTSFGLNHFPFSNVTANNGKHSYIEMVNEAALPVGLADEEGTLYTKKLSGESQMFYSPDDTSKEYQMTTVIDAEFATFGTNTNYSGTLNGGWTYLPGGLILQYGFVPAGGTTVVIYPVQFPTAVFSITVGGSTNVRVTAPTTSSFTMTNQDSQPAYWMAIGN